MTISDKLLFSNVTCPWWLCFTFDNPLRRMLHDPQKILGSMVEQGQTALDIGCGMGYFSVPLAKVVGNNGRVICVDLQEKMLEATRRRAERAGLSNTIELHQCKHNSLGLMEQADFALAFWMVHEVRDKQRFFSELKNALKPDGRLLLVEPHWHVTTKAFTATVDIAISAGFQIAERPRVPVSMAVLLQNAAD